MRRVTLPRWTLSAEEFAERNLAYELVADERAFAHALDELRATAPRSVAVDLEYTMHAIHDRRRLRLVQLGLGGPEGGSRQLLVDAQAVDARRLRDLFAGEAVEKVLHAATGDYEQWLRYARATAATVAEWSFRNVYDPASRLNALNRRYGQLPAATRAEVAAILGVEPPGEGRIVPAGIPDLSELVLGFAFGRSHRHRWGRPVLTEAQLRYAALDVAVLPFVVAWLRALEERLRPLGIDLAAAAAAEDAANRELAADLALVSTARREELDALVADGLRRATRGSGAFELPPLEPAETRYVVRRFRRPRARAAAHEENGRLVLRVVPWRRQRSLIAAAARAAGGEPVEVELRDELERRFLAEHLRRKHPEVELADGRLARRSPQ